MIEIKLPFIKEFSNSNQIHIGVDSAEDLIHFE